jgi:hypothetical protein
MVEYSSTNNIIYENEMLQRIDEFDSIILFNSAYMNPIFDKVLEKSDAKMFFVDGNDDFFLRHIRNNPKIILYLKSNVLTTLYPGYSIEWSIRYLYEILKSTAIEMRSGRKYASKWGIPISIAVKGQDKLVPFPLTASKRKVVRAETRKDIDLSFIGTLNVPDRKRYFIDLLRLKNEKKDRSLYLSSHKITFQKYINIIKRSKLALSFRGVNADTYRYWEIPYYRSALFAQRTPLAIPNDFVDQKSALFFSSIDELRKKFDRYVLKTEEWKEITKSCRRHFVRYHTPKMRVKNFLLPFMNE